MARNYLRPGRYPSRRRRTVWWFVLAVAVIVGAAVLVNDRGTETRREAAFLDATRTLSQEVAQVAAGFRRLVGTELRSLARDDFELLMDRLASEMTHQATGLEEVETPASAQAAREMLDLAFDSWAVGLVEFRTATTDVIDNPMDTAPVDRLGGAIAHLRVGDLVYARFLDRASAMIDGLDVAISEFPVVAFIGEEWALLNAERLARILRGSTQMGVRPDVAILQVVFEPLPSGGLGEDGEIIFPATDRLQFSAVIGNRGNVDQKGLKVTVGIRTESGEAVATADSHTVDLAPGELGSVLFAPESVAPGTEYLLTFSLTVVEDEVNTDDNLWESEVRINPPG